MDQLIPAQESNWWNQLERWGKIAAVVIGLLYAVGLIIQNVYLSDLHIRSLDLFRVKYILVGLYYSLFLLTTLIIPATIIRRLDRTGLSIIGFIALLWVDNGTRNFLGYLLEKIFYLDVPTQSGIFISRGFLQIASVSVLYGCGVLGSIFVLHKLKDYRSLNNEERRKFTGLLIISLLMNFLIFYGYVFQVIPETVGGGKSIPVEIFLATDTPTSITSHFISEGILSGNSNDFEANLVYSTDQVIFFQMIGNPSKKVYEMDRSLVKMVRYIDNSMPLFNNQP